MNKYLFLIIRSQNFDALKNLLDGKINEHTSMLNNFCGFAINQIRLKVVNAWGRIFCIGSMKEGSF